MSRHELDGGRTDNARGECSHEAMRGSGGDEGQGMSRRASGHEAAWATGGGGRFAPENGYGFGGQREKQSQSHGYGDRHRCDCNGGHGGAASPGYDGEPRYRREQGHDHRPGGHGFGEGMGAAFLGQDPFYGAGPAFHRLPTGMSATGAWPGSDYLNGLTSNLRHTEQFILGALIGAAAVYVLGDEEMRAKLIKAGVRLYASIAGGFEEIKEQVADIKAEVAAEKAL